ncbi:transcriptional regulator [Mycolicibacterium cosmeticum]|uniref:Transcriptional regulatory protein n=1 Tax=Mycolicibacterium cosmeticum TaxID=258533 RepID=W9B6R0_MYCCO|nr:BTAD domain-containing putative transcriptional regulator [Mycolicibacterium cosmeticum]TLH81472.1 transcriptional regulator [Mycolicibacterium cosmeticum]CDO10406.1 transcriptional regulatory protein [Mycolicibacterium cosmeticum]
MTAVRICVLGPVRAWVQGEPAGRSEATGEFRSVDLGGPKQRAVLARLVLAHGHVVSVDRLIEDLWEGEPPPKALAALQAYISHLRRVLEPGRQRRAAAQVIVSAAPGYCLRLPDDAVDIWALEAKTVAAESQSDQLEDVLAGWVADPYVEVADTFWAAPEVARLTELRLSAVESYAGAQSALGQHAVVVRLLEPHARDHPGRETAACLLAAAHYRAGRQVAALEVLRRTREYLTDELGLEPGRALRDLERDILRQADHLEPIAVAPAVLPAPAVPASAMPRTRGRAGELAAIASAAKAACREGLKVVWIGGEAGAGKTTLADAAAATLRQSGWLVTLGRCPEVDGAPAGWAWTEVLGTFRPGLDPTAAAALAPLLHDAGAPAPEGGAFWLAHTLADVLGRAASAQPLAVVLDDLHRTDGLTLELLRLVSDRLGAQPVLAVGTYRPSESGAELEMARAALANVTAAHVHLGGLDDAALVELAADCGLPTVTAETLKLLRDRTDGNPLFVREMARLMAAEGPAAGYAGVPAGVRDVVRRRLARLPGQTATALRQAAVLGREVELDLLEELAHSGDEMLDALEPAVLAGLLDEPAPGRIRFAHSLIRDTLYDDTSLLRRTRLHAAALAVLRGRGADAATLAYHAVAAATTETAGEAARFATAAAREADAMGAPGEAARQWRAAVRMLELAAAEPQRAVPARCGLISALARAGDAISAREELNRTVTLAAADDDLLVQTMTALDSPLVWRLRTGDHIDPVIVDPLRRLLTLDHPPHLRARLLITLFKEVEGAEHATAMAASAEALELARALYAQDPNTHARLLCAALNVRAFACLGPDLADQRDAVFAEFLRTAQDCGAVDYQAVGHWLLFLAASGRSDLATALHHVDQAVARAATGQLAYLLGVLDAYSAQLTVLAGRPDEGEARYLAAGAKLAEHGVANGVLVGLVGRVSAALTRGDLGPMADELLVLHRTVSVTMADGAALALMSVGRTAEAREVWSQRVPLERSYYWVAMATLRVHAAVRMGDLAVAREVAGELMPYRGRMAGLDNGTLLTGPVDEALAVLAEADGDTAAAARYRAAAAELTRRLAAEAAALL